MSSPYDAGNTVRVKAVFTNTDTGALFDPATVSATVYSPSGSATPVTPTHDSTGKWSIQFVAAAGGIYTVTVSTTGPVCSGQRRIPINPVPL
jgi:hypothetical protein